MNIDQLKFVCARAIEAKKTYAVVGSRTGYHWAGLWTCGVNLDNSVTIFFIRMLEYNDVSRKFRLVDDMPTHIATDEIATIKFCDPPGEIE